MAWPGNDELDGMEGAERYERLDEERLLDLLAEGATQEHAADSCGISSRTVRRRLREPSFRRELASRRASLRAGDAGRILSLRSKALQALNDVLDTEDEPTKLRAAQMVFSLELSDRRMEIEERKSELDDD